MSLEDTTNLDATDDTADATVDAGAGVDTAVEEPQYDDDGNLIEEDEDVDLDDDTKLKVTKSVAAKLKELKEGSLRQADYTRKTQEVAAAKQAVIAERQQLHQTTQAELDAYAQATTLGQQIAQYQQVDWARWHQEDPFAASAASSQYNVLKDQQQQALGQLSHLRNVKQSMAQQDTAKRMEEGRAVLTREVPGWNEGHKAKLIDFAAGYGFSRAELSDLEADPRVAKVLHAAFEGSDAKRKAAAVAKHSTDQKIQPAAAVRVGSAPVKGLDDRLGGDEWLKRRNAQLQAQGKGKK